MFENVVSKVVLGVIRHIVTAFGGGLVTHGLATQNESNQLVGAVMMLVPIAFSVYDKWQAQGKLNQAKGT